MTNKKALRIFSTALCGVIGLTSLSSLTGCFKKSRDSVVIMTEALSGLFNPFYATSGTDQDVIGFTQIGMLSTDSEGQPEAGEHLPTVALDFEYETVENSGNTETVYTFVIKNDLKFSDGHPLTMNDVLFNMYEYLDPVYTGSSTMYSIDIKGLSQYRTQTNLSDGSSLDDQISTQAAAFAQLRKLELIDIYEFYGEIPNSTSYSLDEAGMRDAINGWSVTEGYKMAVATTAEQAELTDEDYREMLLADYQFTLDTFKKELESDYTASQESYDLETAPYSGWKTEFSNELFKFFFYEGYITPEYKDVLGKKDKSVIVDFSGEEILNSITTKEAAINRVYNDNVKTGLNNILTYWGTAGTLATQYTADAIDVILHEQMGDSDTLVYPNIEGIVSLGHTTQQTSVNVNGKDYKVAQSHDANGVPTNSDEYDVLQITVNGKDPKAIYNFGFTVAPAHYYTADEKNPNGRTIDIANNKFGVEWASSEFQSKTIQSLAHVEVPVGAGPYAATNLNNEDNPTGSEFWSSNVVYFKANQYFEFDVKAEKVRMQVVSASNAIDKLKNGEVDYISPQFTKNNSDILKDMEKDGFVTLSSWQLGYGYVGINAGKVPNVNIRRAIMSAMHTAAACDYYAPGTCKAINWPMSMVSWAYPYQDDGVNSKPNGHDYTQWEDWNTISDIEAKVKKYMNAAGVSAGDSQLSITFTIAGASITEHPTYGVFKQAAEILNNLGWDIEFKADSQALTKLATGSLEVWAAAWGSTIDPDMYQVYHKNSSATSVYAWGYREILSNPSLYSYENGVINQLSEIIDDAREIMDKNARTPLYEQAMSLVLDLAVELPVYQRMTLYAYNSNTITGLTTTINPYSSPLEKLWELELVK